VWYNLNSTNITPPGPQLITDFLVSSFLSSIKDEGFTIYTVRGENLPGPIPAQFAHSMRPNQHYMLAKDIWAHWNANKGRKLNFQGADEAELDAALKASMETWNKENDDAEGSSGMVGSVINPGSGAQNAAPEEPKF